MPFDSNKSVQGHFIDDCELTQDELETISSGKPAKSSSPPLNYLKVQLKEVFITGV